MAGTIGLLLLLLAAYVAPQAYYWSGVSAAVHHHFLDMHGHQVNLDTVCRMSSLPPEARSSAFVTAGPGRLDKLILNPGRWPHGMYHLAAIWGCGLGVLSPWTTRLTNLFFTVVLLLGVVGLTREVVGELGKRRWRDGVRLGLWCGVITLLTPPLLGSSLYFHLDYPLVAMVIMGLYLLLLSRGLTRRHPTINFAIWSLLGMFIKLTYALYLMVPVLVLLGVLLFRRHWRPAVEALAMALAVAALSMVIQDLDLATVISDARAHLDKPLYSGQTAAATGTLRWAVLPLILTWFAYPWPLLLPPLAGLGLAHLRGRISRNRLVLLTAIWGPVVILCVLNNRMERYLHPVYPLFSLLTVFGVAAILPRRWRHPVLALLAALYAGTLAYTHFHRPMPWFWSEEQMVSDHFYYEAVIPGRRQLGVLHANGSHPRCDTTALQAGIAKLMRVAPPTLPLVVGLNSGGKEAAFLQHRRNLDNYLHLYTLQQARGRFIFEANLASEDTEQMEKARQAPLLLSLRPLNDATVGSPPEHVALARETVNITCPGITLATELVLFRRSPGKK